MALTPYIGREALGLLPMERVPGALVHHEPRPGDRREQRLLIGAGTEGDAIGQQPFARLARSRLVDDAVIARCQTWIAEHYHEPSPVAAMVRLSGLAERSFKRRFEQATKPSARSGPRY